MDEKKISYAQAVEQLQQIVSRIENDQIDVDQLSAAVEQARQLIDLCKKKLFATTENVNKILNEME
jgi:exodeoxyribonuclease VII small subunit